MAATVDTDRAKAARMANLDALLREAGAVAARWESSAFRDHGKREATKLFVPDAQEIGAGPALVASSLKTLLRALATVRTDDARRHIAAALRSLVDAVRAEPACKPVDPAPGRNYWADK
jgi:hypothetical protein